MDRRVVAAHLAAAAEHSRLAAQQHAEAARHMLYLVEAEEEEEEAPRRRRDPSPGRRPHRHPSPNRRPRRHPLRRDNDEDDDDEDDEDDLEMGLPPSGAEDAAADGVGGIDDLAGDDFVLFTHAHFWEVVSTGAAFVPPYLMHRYTPHGFVNSAAWLWFLFTYGLMFTGVISFLSVVMFRSSRCCASPARSAPSTSPSASPPCGSFPTPLLPSLWLAFVSRYSTWEPCTCSCGTPAAAAVEPHRTGLLQNWIQLPIESIK